MDVQCFGRFQLSDSLPDGPCLEPSITHPVKLVDGLADRRWKCTSHYLALCMIQAGILLPHRLTVEHAIQHYCTPATIISLS